MKNAGSATLIWEAPVEAERVEFRGRVQGVGFRYTVRMACDRLLVGGWVRNRLDGSVEALLQGERDAIDQVVSDVRHSVVAVAIRMGGGAAFGLLFVTLFGVGGIERQVLLLASVMPAAVINVVFAQRYDAEPSLEPFAKLRRTPPTATLAATGTAAPAPVRWPFASSGY